MDSEPFNPHFGLSGIGHSTTVVGSSVGSEANLAEIKGFENLWNSSRVSLRSYLACHLPTSSLIDDCLQEVAILAWRKAPKDRGEVEFLAYCMGCAKHVRQACIRKNRSSTMLFLAPDVALGLAEEVAEFAPSGDFGLGRLDALRECLEVLDERQREILEARYSGSSPNYMKSVAKKFKRSLPSLYKQLERLRDALRVCVERKILGSS